MDTSNPNEKYFTSIRKRFKVKNYWVYFAFIIFLAVMIPLALTGSLKSSVDILFEQIGYTIIAVISLSLVVGFLGELSLGHAAFMSLGAFIGMYCQQTLFQGVWAASPFVSLLLSMVVGAIVAGLAGFIIGLPALRLKGDYLAIVTLAFGEIVKVVFQNIDAFGGAIGLNNRIYRYDSQTLFIIIFVIAFLAVILIKNLLKSKHGRAIMAIRDNEIAAKAMGVNVTYYKLLVFILSAALAGVAGVLYGASKNQIVATTFDYNYSINNILVMVVIGGMGNIDGSIISAIVVTLINNRLQTIFTGDLAAVKNIIYAVILIAIVMYNNAPSLKNFRAKYNFRKLYMFIREFVRRKIFHLTHDKKDIEKERANQADFGADWSKIPTKIDMDSVVTTNLEVGHEDKPDKPEKGGK